MQEITIGALFLVALGYLGNMLRKSFFSKEKSSCNKGCGCSSNDLSKIRKTVESKS